MYQNYIFDLYGTLVDIHTNEKKAYLWKKMSLFFGMKGAAYEPKELRMAYETKIKEQEAALKMECRGSHVPEIDIADVFRQLFEDQAVSVTEKEIADLAKMFRAISIEELKLFPGVPEMLQRLKDAGKKVFLLSNAQALFTAPEISLRQPGLFQRPAWRRRHQNTNDRNARKLRRVPPDLPVCDVSYI